MSLVNDQEGLIFVPVCSPSSSLEELYALLLAIRLFESSLLDLFHKGVLAGTTHTCLGQEATAVGVIASLRKEQDIIFSNHRGHGHFLAYCGLIESLYAEIMGKPDGICAGRGGSQHLQHRNFYSNGVQGGIMPVATGMALAEKMRHTRSIVTVFIGDGTLGEGAVYEALNIASLWKLPLFIVVELNGYAQSTPSKLQIAGSVLKRFDAFGIPSQELTTTDVQVVMKSAGALINDTRSQCAPHALIINALRMGPHSKGDDFRGKEEMAAIRANDPIRQVEDLLGDSPRRAAIHQQVTGVVELAKTNALHRKTYA